jgi:hypothetical protein
MELRDEQELKNTRAKLQLLKGMYEEAWKDHCGNKARQAELESLMRLINQLKEEIIRFECRHGLRRTSVKD